MSFKLIGHGPGLKYFCVRRDFLDMFGGNFTAAALLIAMEFLQEVRIEVLSCQKSDEEPWFEASIGKLRDEIFAVKSEKTIQEAVQFMEELGVIRVQRTGSGHFNRYLIDVAKVHELLGVVVDGKITASTVLDPPDDFVDGKSTAAEIYVDGNSAAKLPSTKTVYRKTDLKSNYHHQKPDGNFPASYSEKPSFTLFLNLWRNSCPKQHWPNKADRERAAVRWEEIRISESMLKAAMVEFHNSEWAISSQHAIMGFLKNPESWIFTPEIELEMPRKASSSGAGKGEAATEDVQAHPEKSAAPSGANREIGLPPEVEQWNTLCPSATPVAFWEYGSTEDRNLIRLRASPNFEANYAAAMRKNQELLAKFGDQKLYLKTIAWFLKNTNWATLLQGKHDYAIPNGSRNGNVDAAFEAAERVMQRLKGGQSSGTNR